MSYSMLALSLAKVLAPAFILLLFLSLVNGRILQVCLVLKRLSYNLVGGYLHASAALCIHTTNV